MFSSATRAGLVVLPILAAALTGCGNWVTTDIRGITGVTADAEGRPVVIVAACGAAYDRIGVSELLDRSTAPASQENKTLLTMSRASDLTGTETLSLTDPVAPWTASQRFEPSSVDGMSISAYADGADRTTTSVTIRREALAQAGADTVIVRDGESWTRAEFDARACDRDSWPKVTIS